MTSKFKDDVWLLVRKDGKTHNLMSTMMFVGREECDIILQAASSDKRHAVIYFDSRSCEIHIKDLNSLTGTYVNGMRIPEQTYVKLKLLDSIRFGYGPDIFTLQNCKTSPQPSQPDKTSRKVTPEKQVVAKENSASPSPKLSSASSKEAKKSLRDSLEDLNEASYKDTKSLEADVSEPKSIPSAFSSLTFKRSNTRVISSPDVHSSMSSSTSQSKGDRSLCGTPTEENPIVKEQASPVASKPSSTSVETTRTEEKESPEEPGPLTMAFTVAFDNPMPKKKFSIRDSISKYAPKKAEVEQRQKAEKHAEPVIKKSLGADVSKPNEIELKKKKQPVGRNSSMENSWMLKNPSEENKTSEPKLSNGATFLIQKMFRSDSAEDAPIQQSNGSKHAGVYDPVVPNADKCLVGGKGDGDKRTAGNEDAKSDTGTYTVDDDVNDKVVIEARKKIDEVFGIDTSNVQLRDKVPKENSRESFNISPTKDEAWTAARNDLPIIPPVRTKRRLPTPPVQQSNETSPVLPGEALSHSMHDSYSEKIRPHTLNYSTFPKETKRDMSVMDKKLPLGDQIPFNVTHRRLTTNNLELLQKATGNEKTSPVINGHDISPHRVSPSGMNWRRSPWHLSGSDMDLDHMRAETSSVLSDISTSTEPPSMNNPSKNEAGPQMKFNRAFALRRARLGLETELPPPSKSLVLRDSKPPVKDTTLSPFSRQDGGRFSLRLPRNSPKAPVAKPVTKTPSTRAPAVSVQRQLGHRRMDSDPAKTTFLKRGTDQRTPAQDSRTKSVAPRMPFQRAASFTDNPETASDPEGRHSYSWKTSDRKSPLNSIPRLSQVAARKDDDDQLVRESRASPKLIERNELSALDNLVIQATSQLSAKLKTAAYRLLVKERDKFTEDSNERLMIDEVLPRVSEAESGTCSNCSERGISQDLANILKNLKRVEQSLKVLTIVVDEERLDHRRMHCHHNDTDDNLYVVDV